MIPQEIIRAKRDNKKLSNQEIKIFIESITSGKISDSQIASMSMAIFLNGMDE